MPFPKGSASSRRDGRRRNGRGARNTTLEGACARDTTLERACARATTLLLEQRGCARHTSIVVERRQTVLLTGPVNRTRLVELHNMGLSRSGFLGIDFGPSGVGLEDLEPNLARPCSFVFCPAITSRWSGGRFGQFVEIVGTAIISRHRGETIIEKLSTWSYLHTLRTSKQLHLCDTTAPSTLLVSADIICVPTGLSL